MENKIFLGIVGQNGAGKSTACDFLKETGFAVYSLSSVVRDFVDSKGLKQERDTLTFYANQLKQEKGLTYFAEQCFDKVKSKQLECVVFDSVRHPAEVEFLKEKGVYFIGIKVSLEVRYKRIQVRKAATDFIDFETFKKQDEKEKSGQSSGQFIDEAFKLCDDIIFNEDNLVQFKTDLLRVVNTIKEKVNG